MYVCIVKVSLLHTTDLIMRSNDAVSIETVDDANFHSTNPLQIVAVDVDLNGMDGVTVQARSLDVISVKHLL